MPKNKGKGGKNRRRGKNENDNEKRELTFKEEGQGASHALQPRHFPKPFLQNTLRLNPNRFPVSKFLQDPTEYAQVVKMLGNGRLEALCFDGEKRLAHIRGKLRKKVWINQGDIILLSLRDYQDEKGDVILKYSADEARSLKAYGELPETAKINETDTYGHEGADDCNFEFDEDRDESDKEIDVDEI
ncbi:MAG: Translation initiation factor 1A [Sarea resinae]|nr:MAG: Translation initiation factor 1A [Sarea resinae]